MIIKNSNRISMLAFELIEGPLTNSVCLTDFQYILLAQYTLLQINESLHGTETLLQQ